MGWMDKAEKEALSSWYPKEENDRYSREENDRPRKIKYKPLKRLKKRRKSAMDSFWDMPLKPKRRKEEKGVLSSLFASPEEKLKKTRIEIKSYKAQTQLREEKRKLELFKQEDRRQSAKKWAERRQKVASAGSRFLEKLRPKKKSIYD